MRTLYALYAYFCLNYLLTTNRKGAENWNKPKNFQARGQVIEYLVINQTGKQNIDYIDNPEYSLN